MSDPLLNPSTAQSLAALVNKHLLNESILR